MKKGHLFEVEKCRKKLPSLPTQRLVFKRSKFRSQWNLEVLLFVEGGKPENTEKNSRLRERRNKIQVTEVGGERDHGLEGH